MHYVLNSNLVRMIKIISKSQIRSTDYIAARVIIEICIKYSFKCNSKLLPFIYIYIWKILKFNFQSNSYFLIMKLLLLTSFPSPTNLTGNKLLYLSMIFQLWYGLLSKNRKKMYSLLKVVLFKSDNSKYFMCRRYKKCFSAV